MTDNVLVDVDDALMTITINRPEMRNAALRVAILTGAGGTFCSGMDLKAFLRGEVTRVEGRGILIGRGVASREMPPGVLHP